jgi:hypothetical protein
MVYVRGAKKIPALFFLSLFSRFKNYSQVTENP